MEPQSTQLEQDAKQNNQAGMAGIVSSDETAEADGNQYLTFIMAGEEYGVDILCVQEIRGWDSATSLPNAPPHIKGVINLRGTIVPIIDMRQCFGLEATEYTPLTVVIVLKVESEDQSRIMGIVVDAVSDVYTINEKNIQPVPDLGDSLDAEFVEGLINVEGKMVILLEISGLLNFDKTFNLEGITSQIEGSDVLM